MIPSPAASWVARLAALLRTRGVHPAHTVVLLPFAQLLPVAYRQWAAQAPDGFAPRFETTRTWALQSTAVAVGAHSLSFSRGRDTWLARHWLQTAGLGAQAELLAAPLVDAAWELAAVACAQPPHARAAWAASLRGLVSAGHDVPLLATEAALGRVALEWAAASVYPSDGLWADASEPAAANAPQLLVVMEGLQPDPLARALAAQWGARAVVEPLLWPRAPEAFEKSHAAHAASAAHASERSEVSQVSQVSEAPDVDVFDMPGPPQPLHATNRPRLHAARDAADEAERAAACVLQHLAAGRAPVALVALDRALTRRIRAVLAGRGVALRDETGWRLSTTRAAAELMGVLRACAAHASTDAVMDWIKHIPSLPAAAMQALEAHARRVGLRDWAALQAASDSATDGETARWLATLARWRGRLQSSRSLAQWLADVRALLQDTGQWQPLAADAAGAELLQTLGLLDPGNGNGNVGGEGEGNGSGDGALAELAALPGGDRAVEASTFMAWLADALEAGRFVPPYPTDEQVVIVPFAQLPGRSFAAVVMPGCDEQQLPAAPEPVGWWSAAQRAALGLPTREALAAVQQATWAYAVAQPAGDILWRQVDDNGEPLVASPLVQLLQLRGQACDAADPRTVRQVLAGGTPRPLPSGAPLPVDALSATAYEDLRRCPYRFFALRQLGLREADELDAELSKRDFGTWLHAVLGAFHTRQLERNEPPGPARSQLMDEAAQAVTQQQRLAEADFLPFAAAWPALREGYLRWLAAHEAEGFVFQSAESAHDQPLGRVRLVGRIDRIDCDAQGQPMVLDYKTEPLSTTRQRAQQPLEDTQLPFYAALLPHDTLRAAYVNVGEGGTTQRVEQADIVAARDALVEGLIGDLDRLADGAPLPALGEGRVCEFCAARGLCRKDFWA